MSMPQSSPITAPIATLPGVTLSVSVMEGNGDANHEVGACCRADHCRCNYHRTHFSPRALTHAQVGGAGKRVQGTSRPGKIMAVKGRACGRFRCCAADLLLSLRSWFPSILR